MTLKTFIRNYDRIIGLEVIHPWQDRFFPCTIIGVSSEQREPIHSDEKVFVHQVKLRTKNGDVFYAPLYEISFPADFVAKLMLEYQSMIDTVEAEIQRIQGLQKIS